jgi:pimeloyl-ACP methyl ester carboxylesterase
VQPQIGRFTRACAYDRAGMGYSSGAAPSPHTNRRMARELHALLGRAGLGSPYVLVGHSMGGINVRLFASEHFDEVAGMVLVDAMTDEQPSRYWALIPDSDMAEFRAGLSRLHEGLDFDSLVAGFAEMRASSRSIGDKPLVILTRGKEEMLPGGSPEHTARMLGVWHEMQADLSHLSTNAVQIVAENSRHFIQWDAPRLVVASVREVVGASRTHARVNGSILSSLAHESAP